MSQTTGLVKHPIRLKVSRQGENLMEQIFQTTPIRIGRMLDNDLALPFDFVSRYHCELRFDGTNWIACDLGSKNGFLIESKDADQVRLERVKELKLEDGSTFMIQEVTVTLDLMASEAHPDSFEAAHEDGGTIVGARPVEVSQVVAAPVEEPRPSRTPQRAEPVQETRQETKQEPRRESRKEREAVQVQAPVEAAPPERTHMTIEPSFHQTQVSQGSLERNDFQPMVAINLQELLFVPHRKAEGTKDRALQMTTVWHDQVMDSKEFAIGDSISWSFLGDDFELGKVGHEKSSIKIPKGCKAATGAETSASSKKLSATIQVPTAFTVSETMFVYFRYVPKSKELPMTPVWVDEKMMSPLIVSTAIHGTFAVGSFVIATHPPTTKQAEPERFASVIMPVAPTPIPVAVQPTPPPTPEPTPEPTPKIAKKEPTPAPTPEVKKVVIQKKLKKVAVKKAEDPPKVEKPPEKKITQEPPAAPPKPAPTPPPFKATSVGALKALALLNPGPASTHVANVEKIQISRAPLNSSTMASEAPDANAMMNNLNKTVASNEKGGDGVAIGGKSTGGYRAGGVAGKAGNRKIKGSVVGGASYTELSKNEGLTREQVMKVVQKNQSAIQQCYERSLMANPDISGSAEFEWEIAASGSVNFAKVKSATLKNGENLLDCVKGVFMKMKFPTSSNGEATSSTINLPFGRL